jgi:phosphatidylserine/phosphatidylglycerophosphate/cardiolipin synthase-like enzyme
MDQVQFRDRKGWNKRLTTLARFFAIARTFLKFRAQTRKQLANFRSVSEETAAFNRAWMAKKTYRSWWQFIRQIAYELKRKETWDFGPFASSPGYIDRTLNFMTATTVNAGDLGFTFPFVTGEIEFCVSRPQPRVEAFWSKVHEELRQAKHHIHIAMYGIWDKHERALDALAIRTINLLREKAEQGVVVRLLVDSFGSRVVGPRAERGYTTIFDRDIIKHPNIQIVFNDSWNHSDKERFLNLDHRKHYVIDGVLAYVGGMGMEDKFDNTFPDSAVHDMMVRMQGPIVHQFQSSFLDSYCYQLYKSGTAPRKLFGEDKESLRQTYFPDSVERVKADTRAKCVMNVPVASFDEYTQLFTEMVTNAKECLYLWNSCFTDDDLIKALKKTNRRLREAQKLPRPELTPDRNPVIAHLPGKLRMKWSDEVIYLADIISALEAGMPIHRFIAGWLHAKVMMQDHKRVVVGSCNVDFFSLSRNWESGVLLEGEKPVNDLMSILLPPDREKLYERLTSAKDIPIRKRLAAKVFDILPFF